MILRFTTHTIPAALLALGVVFATGFSAAPVQDGGPQKAPPSNPAPTDVAANGDDAAHQPTADEIIERHIDAIGGADALRKFKFRTIKGELEIVGQGINGTIVIRQAEGNKFRADVDLGAAGSTQAGYDGEVGWSSEVMTGPQILEGAKLDELRMEGDILADLNYRQHHPQREVVGKKEFRGAMCWEVKLTSPSGNERTAYYALDTGLLTGLTAQVETPMGKLDTVTHVEKYESVDGIKAPKKAVTEITAMHITQIVTITSVNHDEFSTDVFTLPKEVKALVDMRAKEDKKSDDEKPSKPAPAQPAHED